MSFSKRLKAVCVWAGMSTLVACGGGGGDASPPNLDGVYVQSCYNPDTTAYSRIATLTFSGNKVLLIEDYYAGNGCTGTALNRLTYPEATFTTHGYKNVSGKRAIKIEVTTTGPMGVSGPFTDNGNDTVTINVTGAFFTIPKTVSDVGKDVIALENNLLYWGATRTTEDSAGYPNSLDTDAYFKKQ